MERSSKPITLVWQVCHCEVTDRRDYCTSCFTSKSAHTLEAMRDEDTYLRYSDLRVQPNVLASNVLASNVLAPNVLASGTKA
jgi:hypothetical protein